MSLGKKSRSVQRAPMKRELTYADRLRRGFTDAGDAEVVEAFAGRVRGRKRAMAGRRDAQRICGDQATLLISSTLHPPQKKSMRGTLMRSEHSVAR